MHPTTARERAYAAADGAVLEGPIDEVLRRHPWQFVDAPTQDEQARMNLGFHPGTCVVRVAIAAALAEAHPSAPALAFGEVRQDAFALAARRLLQARGPLPGLAEEILMYEEPHAVLCIGDAHFDPLWTVSAELVHPYIALFPLWEGVACAMTVSEAHLEPDPQAKLRLLFEAEAMCPGTAIVQEAMAAAHYARGDEAATLVALEFALERRDTARLRYALWLLTERPAHRAHIDTQYGAAILAVLEKEGME